MPEVEKFIVGGQEVTGIGVEFEVVKDEPNEYKLQGGESVRVRTEVTRIVWRTDESGNKQYNADGTPTIMVFDVRHVRSRR